MPSYILVSHEKKLKINKGTEEEALKIINMKIGLKYLIATTTHIMHVMDDKSIMQWAPSMRWAPSMQS